MRAEDAIAEIDEVLSTGGAVWEVEFYKAATTAERTKLIVGAAAAMNRLTPPGSPYRRIVAESLDDLFTPRRLLVVGGALRSLRDDYEAGYAASIAELLHAEVFADFVEMAQELLNKGYKDASAVIVGSVLEEHLRKLAEKHDVEIHSDDGKPRTADTLNADLKKAGAYEGLTQKQVTAWLGLRNDAAHGHYDNYDHKMVAVMLQGVADFVQEFPA